MEFETTASSLAVNDPEILEVQDMASGALVATPAAIGSDYAKAIELRMELRASIAREEPKYTCPLCGVAVYLVCRKEARRFFFRHDLEDGRCPAKTRGELSEEEINARKYNGAKESQAHIRMKEIVRESLTFDSRFSDVALERVWTGQDRVSWRKPDVQAKFDDLRMAFEIQLSTTFLRVIAERRVFYLREGGMLLWIFKSFDGERAKLTQDDVFYNNNRNLFLANEETLKASKETGRFSLECHWAEPFIEDGSIHTRWASQIVSIDDLVKDKERQRVFFYDYDGKAAELARELQEMPKADLRESFEVYWLQRDRQSEESDLEWPALRQRFSALGMPLPIYPDDAMGPAVLLNALYSAKYGRVVGWHYKKFIEVAHRIADSHKGFLWLFRCALSVYNRKAQIQMEDKTEKWKDRVKIYHPLMEVGSEAYKPDQQFDQIVALIFPEVVAKLEPYPQNVDQEK